MMYMFLYTCVFSSHVSIAFRNMCQIEISQTKIKETTYLTHTNCPNIHGAEVRGLIILPMFFLRRGRGIIGIGVDRED